MAAFREARETGVHRTGALTRRRDDWRPRERRLGRLSVKATLSVLIAGLSLGGVAVAGIGAAGWRWTAPVTTGTGSPPGLRPRARPRSTPRLRPDLDVRGPSADRSPDAGADSRPGSGSAAPERPARARTSRPTAGRTRGSKGAARRWSRSPGSGSSRRRAAR
ncbi:hypothetical protein ACR6C2_28650 [Streptomyces sp. INA 01156]